MTSETMESLGQAIAGALPDAVAGYITTHGELTLTVNAADIVRVATFLRDDPRCAFSCFIDVTAVDWPQRERRFDVVYHLLSRQKISAFVSRPRSMNQPRSPPSSACFRAPTGSSAKCTTFTA